MSESHIRHSTYHIPEDMLWRKAAKRVRIGSYFLLPFPVEELLQKLQDLLSAVNTGKDSL
ncbi:hypothetical protein A2454_03330 [Candidatus Peribacteria bacterium RIFOXYC2_FULL_55_14]|nr:MAG: hypothetical protein UY87_C0053G0002 [Candidatus Peribacteria bacterium GW2011_GWC2_54_8]OGJ71196.1 MAG: hypothetical protein A2198_01705 [Candidatus Peribacteria bacterium RIFOXYA1_FULL_56_14]OGJ73831.1 MAG: hypothetical protein A2384_04650 [Candidatus Peribacteria bacterium RIFOXYB1_FULL_54_35]OGJ74959.1 MAG: hypothetical protein A2217_03120 [Candidatus Peribacteria bacterium RIFOXYA2_FULL_55_28]OGJ77246.1 MAG: hypothetical protein A2327_06225 [Candidatus Peribacteria bacterium RIFOXY